MFYKYKRGTNKWETSLIIMSYFICEQNYGVIKSEKSHSNPLI